MLRFLVGFGVWVGLSFATTARGADFSELHHNYLDIVTFQVNNARNIGEVVEALGWYLKPAERAQLQRELEKMPPLKMTKTAEGFSLESEGHTISVDLREASRNNLTIDGKKYTVSSSKAPFKTIKQIVGKGQSTSLQDFILRSWIPEAEAQWQGPLLVLAKEVGKVVVPYIWDGVKWLAVSAAIAFSQPVWGYLQTRYCLSKLKKDPSAPQRGECIETARILNESDTAIRKALMETKGDSIKVLAPTCPHQASDKNYRAFVLYVAQNKVYRVESTSKEEKIDKVRLFDTHVGAVVATYEITHPYSVSVMKIPKPNTMELGPTPEEIPLVPGKETDPVLNGYQKIHTEIAGRLIKELVACDRDKAQGEAEKARVASPQIAVPAGSRQ